MLGQRHDIFARVLLRFVQHDVHFGNEEAAQLDDAAARSFMVPERDTNKIEINYANVKDRL